MIVVILYSPLCFSNNFIANFDKISTKINSQISTDLTSRKFLRIVLINFHEIDLISLNSLIFTDVYQINKFSYDF